MLKFLLILGFFLFIIYNLLILPFKRRAPVDENRDRRKKPVDGNVNIDYDPKEKHKNENKGYKGGEYVDYEEVD